MYPWILIILALLLAMMFFGRSHPMGTCPMAGTGACGCAMASRDRTSELLSRD